MVIQIMVSLQAFIGHVRDRVRIAAVAPAKEGSGQRVLHRVQIGLPLQRGRAEHLAVDRAFDRQLCICIGQIVAPGFGPVNALIFHDHRMIAGINVIIRKRQQLVL